MKEITHIDTWVLVDKTVPKLPCPIAQPDQFHMTRQAARQMKWNMRPDAQRRLAVRPARIIVAWDHDAKRANRAP